MSEAESLWAGLASRVIRVALERKAVGYAALADALAQVGVEETERSLIARVSRGTIKFTLLLQILDVTHAVLPPLWDAAMKLPGSWEARAQAVLASELSQQPWVTPRELAHRLAAIGVSITEKTLMSHLSAGTFSMALFIQCVAVLRSTSLDSYIDFPDIVSAAKSGVDPVVQS
ncbi:hypothetical protein WL76_08225 [Burkholderia ubonensis]|uniref:DUF6471 domain-containing protein n=1 Tax=Burkholderia ubonensis TaxID=101571 RepID=UPI00076C4E5B|nr:DUF6471 domain-containing protein [Burkholderia ubonensis]KWE58875.1 hypothetical protein WL76_08225 [Burkholderia ubonensis]